MRQTWYVLEDGSVADPAEVAPDKNGVLRHRRGAVAMRGDVPSTRGVDPEEERAKAKAVELAEAVAPQRTARDMAAEEPKRGYKTR